jgi:hypothetical protein
MNCIPTPVFEDGFPRDLRQSRASAYGQSAGNENKKGIAQDYPLPVLFGAAFLPVAL